jgi:CBS domain containing-hemolysin-like protein
LEDWFLFFGSVAMAMLVSHICSLLEAAFLSITPSQLADMRVSSPGAGKVALELKRDISKPLAVILITNTAAHTIGATIAGASLDAIFHGAKHHREYMTLFSLVFTVLMIQYTELLPKTIGCRFNTAIVRVTAVPMKVVVKLFTPFIWLTDFFNRPFERKKTGTAPSTTEEISALAALARSSQMISRYQERIIKMVPNLSQRTARSVMIETENISFIDSRLSLSDALTITGRDFHTRYPVCEEGDINKIQNLCGLLHLRYKLSNARARAFCAEQVHGKALVTVADRHDCKQEDQHTHTSQPMAEATPIKCGACQLLGV